jgi:hypothetical protein
MGSRKKVLESDDEVRGAVDDLLLSMGLGPDAPMPSDEEESSYEGSAKRRKSEDNAKEEVAPSAGLDALWGSSKRK